MLQPLTLYKCHADDTRLKSLLLIALNDSLCVCDLQHALQLSQPKVSRHLAELRKSDLLDSERRGKWVYYRLADNLPNWARQVLLSTADHNHDYLRPCVDLLAPCCAPKTV
jgi:ArsR family transcriptional regulator